MSCKRNIDFVLYERGLAKKIFRFLPRQSHVHSFDYDPPKSWDEVYKVYYSFKIFWSNTSEEIFDSGCDECSVLEYLGEALKKLIDADVKESEFNSDNVSMHLQPMGMGVDWMITKWPEYDFVDNSEDDEWPEQQIVDYKYEFMLFNYYEKGCRFVLAEEDVKRFIDYLNTVNQYMLEHGEPI